MSGRLGVGGSNPLAPTIHIIDLVGSRKISKLSPGKQRGNIASPEIFLFKTLNANPSNICDLTIIVIVNAHEVSHATPKNMATPHEWIRKVGSREPAIPGR
jgi:hypothetical protein